MNNKEAIEQAVEAYARLAELIREEIRGDGLGETMGSLMIPIGKALQAEPQYVDVDSFPSIDPNLFAVYLGQMKIGKKIDKVMIERFFGFSQVISDQHELIYNTPAQTQPEPIDGLDEALSNIKDFNTGDFCELQIDDVRDLSIIRAAAKAYAELTKGKE